MNDAVVPGESEISHQSEFFRKLVVIGCDGAALGAVEELGGVEAEYFSLSEIPHVGARRGASESMCGVEHQSQPAPRGNFLESRYIADRTPHMDANDPGGARRD